MDPLSLAGTCFSISKFIYTNIQRCNDLDQTLDVLSTDQAELAKVVDIFRAGIGGGDHIDVRGQEQWDTLESSVLGLSKAMKSLEDILTEVKGVRKGFVTRPAQVRKLDNKANEIDALKKSIEAYTRTIQLSVQYINLYDPAGLALTLDPLCAE